MSAAPANRARRRWAVEGLEGAWPKPRRPLPASSGGARVEGNAIGSSARAAFVQQDGVWIQTTFNPDTMETEKVEFASDDYFALLERYPDLAGAFALGDRVIAISHGTAYEVTAP